MRDKHIGMISLLAGFSSCCRWLLLLLVIVIVVMLFNLMNISLENCQNVEHILLYTPGMAEWHHRLIAREVQSYDGI
jgi:type II secretory pathway component PulF